MTTGPEAWGPPIWATLHAFAAAYPETAQPSDAARARAWFQHIRIPCASCQAKYDALVRRVDPADLRGREALFAWTVRIHNMVNVLLRKPVVSEDEAKKKYGLSVSDDFVSRADALGYLGYRFAFTPF